MRPVTIELNVLVRDPVNDNAWPGSLETVTFDDASCPSIDGDKNEYKVEQGFVVMDFDSNPDDSAPAPAGWQYFNQAEASELIASWVAQSLEWHPATKITCSNDPDNFYIVSDSFYDVQNAFAICCSGQPEIPTQALALKTSNNPLTVGTEPPCGTPAKFIWLAIFGNTEERTLVYSFVANLRDKDNAEPAFQFRFPFQDSLTATTQASRNWPEDFIGLTSISGVTLIANDQEPSGPSEKQVKFFDFGSIEWFTNIEEDLGEGNFAPVSFSTNFAALPGTQCGEGCVNPYDETMDIPGGSNGTPFNFQFLLLGAGPFQFEVISKPDWMTVTPDLSSGLIVLSGTPDEFGDFEFQYRAENCGEPITEDTPASPVYEFTIQQAFLVQNRGTIPGAQNFSGSIWAEFLGMWIAWVGTDDSSGFRMATSTDGETWTLRSTAGITAAIGRGCAGADRCIWVGSSGTAIMTVDGINYTTFALPQAIQHTGIAYSPSLDLFVISAQQGSNRVFTTVDGSSVNVVTAPVQNAWRDIAWSVPLGLFVMVSTNGTNNQVLTSPDGTTWTSQTTPGASRQWSRVRFVNDKFIALATNGSGGQRMMYSTDAVNWTLITLSQLNGIYTDVDYGNGLYLAITSQPGADYFWSSLDGISWTARGTSPAAQWTGCNFNGVSRFLLTGLGAAGNSNLTATVDWFA